MGRLVLVVVLLVAGVVGLGFYQGWFQLSTDRSDQKTKIAITVDQEKMQQDKKKAQEKLQDLEHKIEEKTKPSTDQAKPDKP